MTLLWHTYTVLSVAAFTTSLAAIAGLMAHHLLIERRNRRWTQEREHILRSLGDA